MRPRIPRESVEAFAVEIVTDADPTSGAIEFALTAPGDDRPEAWTPGSWAGTPTKRHGKWTAVAHTPLIGAEPLDLDPGRWWAWSRYTGQGAEFVRRVGEVDVV